MYRSACCHVKSKRALTRQHTPTRAQSHTARAQTGVLIQVRAIRPNRASVADKAHGFNSTRGPLSLPLSLSLLLRGPPRKHVTKLRHRYYWKQLSFERWSELPPCLAKPSVVVDQPPALHCSAFSDVTPACFVSTCKLLQLPALLSTVFCNSIFIRPAASRNLTLIAVKSSSKSWIATRHPLLILT